MRSVILPGLIYLYVSSGEPMMLVLTGIVGLGFILTPGAYIRDRRDPREPE